MKDFDEKEKNIPGLAKEPLKEPLTENFDGKGNGGKVKVDVIPCLAGKEKNFSEQEPAVKSICSSSNPANKEGNLLLFENWSSCGNEHEYAKEYVRDYEFKRLSEEIDKYLDESIEHLISHEQLCAFLQELSSRGYSSEKMRSVWDNLKHFIMFAQSSPEKTSIAQFESWEFSRLVFDSIPRKYIGPDLKYEDICCIFESLKLLYDYFYSEGWINKPDVITEAVSLIIGDKQLKYLEPEGISEDSIAFALSSPDGNFELTYRDVWVLLVWARDFDGEWEPIFTTLSSGMCGTRKIRNASKKLFRAKWLHTELKKKKLIPKFFFHRLNLGLIHIKTATNWFYDGLY